MDGKNREEVVKLKDLSYKELIGKMRDMTNEFAERFNKDPKGHADEFVAIRDIELGISTLETSLEQSGKITPGEPK